MLEMAQKCCYLRRSLSLARRENDSLPAQGIAEMAVKLWQCFGITANLAVSCQRSCLGFIPLSFTIPKVRRLEAQNSLNHCKMTLSQTAEVLLAVLQGSQFA